MVEKHVKYVILVSSRLKMKVTLILVIFTMRIEYKEKKIIRLLIT